MVSRAPRADAARNRDAIVDAALEVYGRDPQASLADIAAAAGIGRVTLYGHFASREELLEAALRRAIERAESTLAALDLSGDALAALDRLVRSSWEIVAGFHGLLAALQRQVDPEHVRSHHAAPHERLAELIRRGQADGSMRSDLPVTWLVACITAVVHTAAGELRAGRLAADPSELVAGTVRALVVA